MNPTEHEDRQLLAACLAGDREAAGRFIQRFSNLVYGSIRLCFLERKIHHDREDLADLHNSVFLKLFEDKARKLGQFQGKNGCSLASWIRVIAVRFVLDHFRKKGFDSINGRDFAVCLADLSDMPGEAKEAWTILEEKDRDTLLHRAIASLAGREKLLLEFHISQGLPLAEVSELMGITVQNAYTIKSRLVRKMKELLAEM